MKTYTDEQVREYADCLDNVWHADIGDILLSLLDDRQRLQAAVKEQSEQMEAEAIVTGAYFDRIAELEAEVEAYKSAVREFQDGRRYSNLHTRQVARDIEQCARATPNETKEAKS